MFGSSDSEKLQRAFTKAFRGQWRAYQQADGSFQMSYSIDAKKADAFHDTLSHQGFITYGTSGSLNVPADMAQEILSTTRGR